MDCEDSVAAVDAEDKVLVYRNWLGLMKGDLEERFEKGRQDDHPQAEWRPRIYRAGRQAASRCKGRSLMLVRNVGHLMTNPPISTATATRFPKA
jgi:malate synthase